jgi:phage terminase large subunit-like protein
MIKRIYEEKTPILKKSEKEVNEFLNELRKDDKEYIVGIDYASIYSPDYTAVAYFYEDEEGTLKLEGIKLL